VIASIAFRRFKALRNAGVRLEPFNLVLGPNGSGKTSLIEALLHLRTLSTLAPIDPLTAKVTENGPSMVFHFRPPHEAIEVRLACVDSNSCDALHVIPPDAAGWPALREEIASIRSYAFDPEAMAAPAPRAVGAELAADGANLAAVLAEWSVHAPTAFAAFTADALRLFPEFMQFALESHPGDRVGLAFTLIGEVGVVRGEDLSQGMLHTLAVVALAAMPSPPAVIGIEEVDRGVHPRMLREVRDALYRLTYPGPGSGRRASQVVATTHSPYLLDLFRDHPEEVVISQKVGREAHFERLSDRADLAQLLEEGSLGDIWFSGILGGVPPTE
jgi:predicted ATPase